MVVAFVALFITLSLSSDVFLTAQNMKNLAFQTAPVGIIAAGGTIVFIAGRLRSLGRRDLGLRRHHGRAVVQLARHRPLAIADPRRARRARLRPRQRAADHDRPRQRVHGHARDIDHHQRPRSGGDEREPRLGLVRALRDPRPRHGLGDQLPRLRLVRLRGHLRLRALAHRLRPLRLRRRRQPRGGAPLGRAGERRARRRPSRSRGSRRASPA